MSESMEGEAIRRARMAEWDRLVTSAMMAGIDRAAQEELGIPGVVLMENAGRAAWEAVREGLDGAPGHHSEMAVVFCVGPGNNGGDALVMARWALLEGWRRITVVSSRRTLNSTAASQAAILARMGAPWLHWDEDDRACTAALEQARLIVDGLAGTGLSGPLREEPARLVDAINRSRAVVISIDVPSGSRDGYRSGEPLVRANCTVVTGYRKRSLYTGAVRDAAGEIRQVDPGFPPQLVQGLMDREATAGRPLPRLVADAPITLSTLFSGDPPPPIGPDSHKGSRGRVGVIAGGPGTVGAAILAGMGALKGGAGMVRVVLGDDGGMRPALDPSLMVVADSDSARLDVATWADVLVAGPGWTGAGAEDLCRILELADERKRPLVLDAHALRLLAEGGSGSTAAAALRKATHIPAVVLTPHPGELAALADVGAGDIASDPWGALERVAGELPAYIVLKGSVTIVRDPNGETTVFDGRCPALGTAGSGDVLAGLIGAWCARPLSAGEAIRAAVALHLNAGRGLLARRGWFTATELVSVLGEEEFRARE